MSSGRTIEKVLAQEADLIHFTKIINESFPDGQEYNGRLEKTEYCISEHGWKRKKSNVSFAQSLPIGRVKEVVKVLRDNGSRVFDHMNNPATESLLENETIAATLDFRSTNKFN